MIDRDRKVKEAPERFQDEKKFHFDIIIAYEKRVYEIVVNGMLQRLLQLGRCCVGGESERVRNSLRFSLDTHETHSSPFRCSLPVADLMLRNNAEVSPCHVINLDTTDNRDEARNSALLTVRIRLALFTLLRAYSLSLCTCIISFRLSHICFFSLNSLVILSLKLSSLSSSLSTFLTFLNVPHFWQLELVREIASATGSGGDPDWENHLTRIFDEFEAKFSRHVLHTVLFY